MVLLLPCLLLASPVRAQEGDPSDPADSSATREAQADAEAAPARKPSLGLDSLLRPRGPAPRPVKQAEPGGRDRQKWQEAFAEVRREIEELERSLDKARVDVSERSQGGYQYSPVGGEAPSDPEILKLRAQMRRDKKSLEGAKSRLRDLQVEASLAGVPEEWTQPSGAAGN